MGPEPPAGSRPPRSQAQPERPISMRPAEARHRESGTQVGVPSKVVWHTEQSPQVTVAQRSSAQEPVLGMQTSPCEQAMVQRSVWQAFASGLQTIPGPQATSHTAA